MNLCKKFSLKHGAFILLQVQVASWLTAVEKYALKLIIISKGQKTKWINEPSNFLRCKGKSIFGNFFYLKISKSNHQLTAKYRKAKINLLFQKRIFFSARKIVTTFLSTWRREGFVFFLDLWLNLALGVKPRKCSGHILGRRRHLQTFSWNEKSILPLLCIATKMISLNSRFFLFACQFDHHLILSVN